MARLSKVLSVFALLVLAGGWAFPSAARAAIGTEVIQGALPSLVVVRTTQSEGSGFVVTSSGYMVSAAHVIGTSKRVEILTASDTWTAEVVARDENRDLVLLRLEGTYSLPGGLPIARPESVVVGMEAYALGTPLGQASTVTKGIVSSASREENGVGLIQIDAALNPGNSGGPVIDSEGFVIGVSRQVMREGEGMGFAVSAAELRGFLADNGLSVDASGRVVAGSETSGVPTDASTGAAGGDNPTRDRVGWTGHWWLLLIGFGAGAVLASAAAVLVHVIRGGRKPRPDPDVRIEFVSAREDVAVESSRQNVAEEEIEVILLDASEESAHTDPGGSTQDG